MILNELFENKNMTEAMKPSDIPTAMRTDRLSMQDVEAERPQGAFRIQVTYPDGHISYFMDKTAAEQAAGPEGGRVDLVNQVPQGNPGQYRYRVRDPFGKKPSAVFQDRASAQRYAAARKLPIEIISDTKVDENLSFSGPPETVGYMYITMIQRTKRTEEPVTLDYGFGKGRYKITDPRQKEWLVSRYNEAQRAGKQNPELLHAFLTNMGTKEGFEALIRRMQRDLGNVEPQAAQQTANEAVKKNSEISEADLDTVNPRTKRILRGIRARQPQAQSDIEALLYDVLGKQKKDREDITRLEKDRDDAEQDLKKDLERQIDTLKQQRRSPRVNLDQIKATNKKQDQAIQRLAQVQSKQDALDAEQSRAIDDLEAAIKAGKDSETLPMPTGGSRTVVKPATKTTKSEPTTKTGNGISPTSFGQMAQQLTQPSIQSRQVRGIPKEIPISPTTQAANTDQVDEPGQAELDIPRPNNVTSLQSRRRPRQAELDLAAESRKK